MISFGTNLQQLLESRGVEVIEDSSYRTLKERGLLCEEGIIEETERYKIFENSFLDKKTNLMWEKKTPNNIEDRFTWREAKEYAEKLNSENFGGYSNWRLATKEELKTLLTQYYGEWDNSNNWNRWFQEHREKRNSEKFLDSEITNFIPKWSWLINISKYNSSFSWAVGFYNGYDDWLYQADSYYAVCVRASPLQSK